MANRLALDEETAYTPASKELDTSYADPLGPAPERPRTSGVRGAREEEFEDEEIGDDLLPE